MIYSITRSLGMPLKCIRKDFFMGKSHIHMKTKIIIFALIFFSFLSTSAMKAFAAEGEKSSQPSATFAAILEAQSVDNRAFALEKYLEAQDSPLAPYASVFVHEADKNGLPWNFVAAISGTESSFGKVAPCNNFYGFGIYGTHMLCFNSIEDGIKTVSQALRDRYINGWGCQTVAEIGSYYAASNEWAGHTQYFMNEIEAFRAKLDTQALPISL